jgi:hypothetical protein
MEPTECQRGHSAQGNRRPFHVSAGDDPQLNGVGRIAGENCNGCERKIGMVDIDASRDYRIGIGSSELKAECTRERSMLGPVYAIFEPDAEASSKESNRRVVAQHAFRQIRWT